MVSSVLYNYLDRLNIESGRLRVWYGFDNSSGEVLYNNVFSASEHYTGNYLRADRYPGLSVGYTEGPSSGVYGSGVFSFTDMLRVGYQVDFSEWTAFFNFKTLNACADLNNIGTVLLSNKVDYNLPTGFIFGLTQSNRPFIEYYENSEKHTKILNTEISQQAILSLSKDSLNNFEVIYHDYTKRINPSLSFNTFNYSDSSLLNHTFGTSGLYKNGWLLGGIWNGGSLYTGMSGQFDDFMLFDRALGFETKNAFVPSFFVTGITPATTGSSISYVGSISEVVYNPTGFLGTGHISSSYTGVSIPQKVGADISLYNTYNQTGYITGETFDYITGAPIAVTTITTVPEVLNFDLSYLYNYTKPSFVYKGFSGVAAGKALEVYHFNEFVDDINLDLSYVPFYGYFQIDKNHTGVNVNIYSNKLLQQTGVNFDYNISSRNVFASGFNNTDTQIYDVVAGSTLYLTLGTGAGSYNLTGLSYRDIYLNGYKLVSGLNYTGTSESVSLLNWATLGSGNLQLIPRHTGIYQITTGSNPNFRNTLVEQVWINGERIQETDNYFRTNACTMRAAANLTEYTSMIYNNDDWGFNL